MSIVIKVNQTSTQVVKIKSTGPQGIDGTAGGMQASVYDPTPIAADVFDMDNMVEGTTTKVLTDAERTVIGNQSGTNTGDQSSIVGITGTVAQFNAAMTDATLSGDNTGDQDLSSKENVGIAAGLDGIHLNNFVHGNIAHSNRSNLDTVDQDLATTDEVEFDTVATDMIKFDLAAGETVSQGEMAWNPDEETLDLGQNGAVLQIGQEIHYHVRNTTGVQINNGDVVMATGTVGASGRILVALMDGTSPSNAKYILGVATENIADNTDGKVSYFGKVRGIDTSAWADGDVLYVSPTVAGAFVNVEPAAPLLSMPIAFVIYSDASVGSLSVRIHPTDENRFAAYSHNHTASNVTDFDTEVGNHTDVAANTSVRHTQGTDTTLGAVGTKATPIDADKVVHRDSTDSDALVTSTWAQVKAFLKTYLDTLYAAISHASTHINGTDDIQSATNAQKGLATSAHITAIEDNTSKTGVTSEISNVVEDTTPELGGELDAGAHTIGFTEQSATGDGTTTIDWKLGNKFKFTFGAFNEVFTFTAPSNPCSILLVMVQDGTGSRTATWPATVKWAGGIAPTLSTDASSIDIASFYWDGTNYFGMASLAFSVPA